MSEISFDGVSMDPDESWPVKAYKNLDFLNSPAARTIRILSEYTEPFERFGKLDVRDMIVFFGSARIKSPEVAAAMVDEVKALQAAGDATAEVARRLDQATAALNMSRYYEESRQLAYRLTEWAKGLKVEGNRFAICSGGGPGIMEAANRGAMEAGGPSVGLNISLPMEQNPNPYQTPELSFEFHYFFIRKFWFVSRARAMVAFPGGFGTMDELFELLTLLQTHKTHSRIPVVVYGREFWERFADFEFLAECGMINHDDLDLIEIIDDVDTAFEYLRDYLTREYLESNGDGDG
jgi:uncharacterized protein (TIGR00730 family)